MTARRLLVAVFVAALALSGCSRKHNVVSFAKTEGIYIDVGPLDYQVQHSRQINPRLTPDKAFLTGLPEFVTPPTKDETWFAVWLRVENQTKAAAPAATKFEITDTLGKVYEPMPIRVADNPLAYGAPVLQPKEVFPSLDSVAGDATAQGALLIFKISYGSLGNRPLEFKIKTDTAEGVVDLDV
jgi:hypothetical protein